MNYQIDDLCIEYIARGGEDWIEKKVERMVDNADKKFLKKEITEIEYDLLMKQISNWAESCYYTMSKMKKT